MIVPQLSPSDLVWLWNDCPRCFYDKYVHGVRRPWGGMPRIFNRIDAEQKMFYAENIITTPDKLRGKLAWSDVQVKSEVIELSHGACVVAGRLDAIFRFEDCTHGVVDFKTSAMTNAELEKYDVQLMAYAYALEHPADTAFGLAFVDRLSLVTYMPVSFHHRRDKSASLEGKVQWIDLPRDDGAFLWFLDTVMLLLNGPPPAPSSRCAHCTYRGLRDESRIAA